MNSRLQYAYARAAYVMWRQIQNSLNFHLQTAFGAIAFAATNFETAHAAFVGQSETSRSRDDVRNFAFVIQFAMIFETVDDIGHRKPQTLTPVVYFAKSRAIRGF